MNSEWRMPRAVSRADSSAVSEPIVAYDAGVDLVGMSNLLTFLQNTAPYRRKLRASEYGDPEKDRDALLQLSPMTYIDRIKGPLLIMQGATDPRVPAGEAVQIYEALSRRIRRSIGNEPQHRVMLGEIGHDHSGPAAGCDDLLTQPVGRIARAQGVEHHRKTAPRQRERNRAADALGATGDEGRAELR